ncbi:MAG TPA: hypothetical protein VEI26_16920, partial [Terriglobales bacterium]|nr:hypothetical protein [Terriglobales bacterium]
RDPHQQDAYAAAEWLRRSDLDGSLERLLNPSLTDHERHVAEIEGWIRTSPFGGKSQLRFAVALTGRVHWQHCPWQVVGPLADCLRAFR